MRRCCEKERERAFFFSTSLNYQFAPERANYFEGKDRHRSGRKEREEEFEFRRSLLIEAGDELILPGINLDWLASVKRRLKILIPPSLNAELSGRRRLRRPLFTVCLKMHCPVNELLTRMLCDPIIIRLSDLQWIQAHSLARIFVARALYFSIAATMCARFVDNRFVFTKL